MRGGRGPLFPDFRPCQAGVRSDPEGEGVRRWVPELSRLPAAFIHAPREAPPSALEAAGVRLGSTYPRPMVDHAQARAAALDAFKSSQKFRRMTLALFRAPFEHES